MQDIGVAWNVDGVISPEESVQGVLKVIAALRPEHSGTFWTWEGKVKQNNTLFRAVPKLSNSATSLVRIQRAIRNRSKRTDLWEPQRGESSDPSY